MDNSLETVLAKSKSILIVLPTNPYFDQVASALALSLSLRGRKDTVVYSPTPMTVEFNRLVGVNKIKNEIGDKNLVIKFTDYDGKNVERVSADIENGLFQLTVIPKQDAFAPQKNQVDISYSGVASDTVVLIGGASDVHFPLLASDDLAGATFVHIGIRPLTLSDSKSVQSFTRDASSICEIVAGFMTNNIPDGQPQNMPFFALEADVATNLVMGIEITTNSFSTSTVSANTFSVMASLMMAGGQRQPQRPIPDNFPPGSIPQAKPSVQKTEENTTNSNQADDTQKSSGPKDWIGKPRIYKGTDLKSS